MDMPGYLITIMMTVSLMYAATLPVNAEEKEDPVTGVELILTNNNSLFRDNTGELDTASADYSLPALMLQYNFEQTPGLRPYAGIGINYRTFNHEQYSQLLSPLPDSYYSFDHSGDWGVGLQLGADYSFENNWHINFDTRFSNLDGRSNRYRLDRRQRQTGVELDPWSIGIGVGKRF